MSVVAPKYAKLSPRMSVLQDQAVLAQAWKKTHTYVRRHNWYVDTLELDTSAVCLTDIISRWSESIANGDYQTSDAWLVPAPKSGLWKFDAQGSGGWSPFVRDGETGPVLRPLAHIGIKDQTVATAVMLCLADCIESAQGDTSLSPLDAAKRGVYSYGNRLFCHWSENHAVARFPWGNSKMYSRYFQDYQRFVDRPIATALLKESEGVRNVFIVTLDVSAFFDNIDIDWLISCLEREYKKFAVADRSRASANSSFWTTARKALTFQWRQQDVELAHLFRDSKLPNGLPQGLAASGFFANAYLLGFDRAIGRAIGRLPRGGRQFTIHDYCRYVDDLRLVISVDAEVDEFVDEAVLAHDVSTWVGNLLKKHTTPQGKLGDHLQINAKKTEIERLGEVGGDSRTAARMKALQQQLSGPFDLNSLRQAESGLNGLLSLAELGLLDEMEVPQGEHPLRLASITKNKLEVRDDTLTRFSAYRLMRSLRMRRSMTDLTETIEDGRDKEDLLHDFQTAARRLVAAWATNPSLVQVLRYALDLFPSEELLEPISQALVEKIGNGNSTNYEERVVFYVLAELFKAGATETGYLAEQDVTFVVADVSAYRLALAALAQNVLELGGVPWYVQQQASLLLASIGQAASTLSLGPELRLHRALHAFVKAERCADNVSQQEEVVISLVGHQLLNDASHYISWFKNFCEGRRRATVSAALKTIGQTAADLFTQIMKSKRVLVPKLASFAPNYLSRYWAARWSQGDAPLPTGRWITLVTAITHPTAPFAQENALLKLALMLAQSADIKKIEPEFLTPLNLQVRSTDWNIINDPRTMNFELRLSPTSRAHDSLYETPSWCRAKDAWMYAFGRILRAAATGEPDFTARHWLVREDAGWYLGLRSSWGSRRMGMLHTSQALRGTTSAITPWFSDLLLELLRWPGITEQQETEIGDIATRRKFENLVRNRLKTQCAIYGESSNLPIYRYPVAEIFKLVVA